MVWHGLKELKRNRVGAMESPVSRIIISTSPKGTERGITVVLRCSYMERNQVIAGYSLEKLTVCLSIEPCHMTAGFLQRKLKEWEKVCKLKATVSL